MLGESLASTTLVAATSSMTVLQAIFPGSDETSFSLTSFVTLVRREWSDDMQDHTSPQQRYGFTDVMKALIAWVTVQGKTSAWQEKKWFKFLKEIDVENAPGTPLHPNEGHHTVHFTRDASHSNQIITADIGEIGSVASPGNNPASAAGPSTSVSELKATLRRCSKLVLAGYGGASLLFFGVPPVPIPRLGMKKEEEQAQLAMAVNSSEQEFVGSESGSTLGKLSATTPPSSYSWWNVLLGKHDKDILLHYADAQPPTSNTSLEVSLPSCLGSISNHDLDTFTSLQETPTDGNPVSPANPPITATLGSHGTLLPRFWVLTDHTRREVVLVLRGTMSLNELAVDLTCDPADFHLHHSAPPRDNETADEEAELDAFEEQLENMPGAFPMDLSTPSEVPPLERAQSPCSASSEDDGTYQVHGGMLKMAKTMGSRGKPVHIIVRHALKRNEGYSKIFGLTIYLR